MGAFLCFVLLAETKADRKAVINPNKQTPSPPSETLQKAKEIRQHREKLKHYEQMRNEDKPAKLKYTETQIDRGEWDFILIISGLWVDVQTIAGLQSWRFSSNTTICVCMYVNVHERERFSFLYTNTLGMFNYALALPQPTVSNHVSTFRALSLSLSPPLSPPHYRSWSALSSLLSLSLLPTGRHLTPR